MVGRVPGTACLAIAALAALATAAPAHAASRHARDASHETLLRAPFSPARASYFHAALDVPPFESARPLARGTLLFRLRTTSARSNERWTGKPGLKKTNFDGTYHEWKTFELTGGFSDRLEISGRATIAGWDEHQDRFNLFTETGQPLVRHEDRKILGIGATSRHVNMSVLGLRAKWLMIRTEDAGYDLSLGGSVKFPIGRDRDLTHAGTTDLGLTLRWSRPTGWGAWHAALGGVAPLGDPNLFVEGSDSKLNEFAHVAAGATWVLGDDFALGAHVEANSSAFKSVDVLSEDVVSLVGGMRKTVWDRLVLEAAGGVGLRWTSTYQWMYYLSAAWLF